MTEAEKAAEEWFESRQGMPRLSFRDMFAAGYRAALAAREAELAEARVSIAAMEGKLRVERRFSQGLESNLSAVIIDRDRIAKELDDLADHTP